MSKRIALLVINHSYRDRTLSRLKTPEVDTAALVATLHDPEIGNFDVVETMRNQRADEIRAQIIDLLHGKKKNDLLLLYFSGLSLLDESGQIYLAAFDTAPDYPNETAIPASFVTERFDLSFSRQQILILDCHFSDLADPVLDLDQGSSANISANFKGKGYGRVILSGSDRTQYALTGADSLGQPEDSLFTHYLIRGLQTGAADADRDGQVSLRELHDYIYDRVVRHSERQKPRRWTFDEQDKFIIARNPNKTTPEHRIKWDLILGAIVAPTATIVIGGQSDLGTSVGFAGLLLLVYAFFYWALA